MKIAIAGITGNMGKATFAAFGDAEFADKIVLLSHSRKKMRKLLKTNKKLKNKVETVEGSLSDPEVCRKLIDGADLVVNMSAVIPPKSDQSPQKAIECNQVGVDALVSEIEKLERQPAFVHISTMALYGNRAGAHKFGRVGDPLLVSPFDVYSATKLRGEFRVLESKIHTWAVLRQSAMLHPQMLADNVHDGLMFHTCFDAPLEWVTAHDSGVLIRNIAEKFARGDMPERFWKKVYNIGGGKANRCYGYDTLADGFAIIGGDAKKFFEPGYNATRNFHGLWFSDGHVLDDMFGYVSQTTQDYWQEILRAHPVYKMGRIVPKGLIAHFAVKRLRKDPNAPAYWAKHADEPRLLAYFGGKDKYDELQKRKWADFPVPDRKLIPDCDDYSVPIEYGYDFDKADDEITAADLRSVAEAHGGKLLSDDFTPGELYTPLEWETQDGEKFTANAYTVLRAGHWYSPVYSDLVWDFDRLSKRDRVFASVWYDSHEQNEDMRYSLDGDFKSHAEKISQ